MFLSWLWGNLLSLLILVIAGVTMWLTYKSWHVIERIEFDERTCAIFRSDNSPKIKLDAFMFVSRPYLRLDCEAKLKINSNIIILRGIAFGSRPSEGTYNIWMESDDIYERELSGKGLLVLQILSHGKKIKIIKLYKQLAIPAFIQPEAPSKL